MIVNILTIISSIARKYIVAVSGKELPSPKPRIKSEEVLYYPQLGQITINNIPEGTWITTVMDTNSMDPVFDIGHLLILTPITDHSDLIVGDIVNYKQEGTGYDSIIHRITKITIKDGVRHYECKGDNCVKADPYDLIDGNIKYLYRGHLV